MQAPTQNTTWLLESVGAETRVTLVHSGFVRAGWAEASELARSAS